MQISAIIMAGGKGKRFNFDEINTKYDEKLLLKVQNKFIIEYIINALRASEKINRIVVSVSPHSIYTKRKISSKYESIEVINTPGKGFHADLKFIIKKLGLKITLIISGDLPLIKTEIIDKIIIKFIDLKRPALSVMTKADLFKKQGLNPTIIIFNENFNEELVPLGINIINGDYIDQDEIDQAIMISEDPRLFYNINTTRDLEQLIVFIDQTNFFFE